MKRVQRIKINCVTCEKTFEDTSSKIKRGRKFCSRSCASNHDSRRGKNSPSYKNGKCANAEGYILVLSTEHPHTNKNGYVLEHRLIMEKKLKRHLTRKEIIHHKNGIKSDNRIVNLELLSRNQHNKTHNKGRTR